LREIGKILAYAAAVIVLGALAAPLLYWGGRAAADVIPELGRVPFARYFNRAIMIVAVALLWPFLRWIGVRRWTELELEANPHRWRDLGIGAGLATVGLWSVALVAAGFGLFTLHAPAPAKVLGSLATGVAVALFEETFFRGALFGVLRRNLTWQRALAFLSVLFAILHFIKPHRAAREVTDVGWLSGFDMLPYAFWRFSQPELVLFGFVTLVIFGWILGWVVVRTRSLYMSIGLHGGWVFALRSFDDVSRRAADGGIWLGSDMTTGVVPVALLIATGLLLARLLRAR
jgi:uncharacterized protein